MAEGSNGNYDNDSTNNTVDDDERPRRQRICRFYRSGHCRFGPNCWNLHGSEIKPSNHYQRNNAGPSHIHTNTSASQKSSVNKPYEAKYYSLNKNQPKRYVSSDNPPNWVNAPEFVPEKIRSYADTVKCNIDLPEEPPEMEFCEYYVTGECPDEDCPFLHGDICELCGKACLDPLNERQRKTHTEECEKELEKDMELSFAIQRSRDKTCGICFDIILDKERIVERRFGILEKCNHVFCLDCIRQWRRLKTREPEPVENTPDPVVIRGCPECRVASDFVTPSQYWVDDEEDKKKMIAEYKLQMSKKDCKYFKKGQGTCPFGGACFYLHAKPDGTKVDLPLPIRRRRRNQNGETDFMHRVYLWDFLGIRRNNIPFDLVFELEDEDFFPFSDDDSDDDSDDFNIYFG